MAEQTSQQTLAFSSLEEANDYIKETEIKTFTKYILQARTKNAKISDIQSLDRFLVKFEDLRGEIPVYFDGVPFIQLGTEVRECHQGPDRKLKKKKKALKVSEASDDHDYSGIGKKRSHIQVSKKLGCSATVKFRMLLRFPTFKINGPDSKKARKDVIHRLRETELKDEDKEYRVLVRFCGDHHDHVIGQEAGFGQPLDASIISKIRQLVLEDGLRSSVEIKKHVELLAKKCVPECPATNRRFYPTMQDIRYHMCQALNSNRYNNDDQQNLIGLINSWKEKCPDDYYFFQPASCDENGEMISMLFVHQTDFQRKLLHKYGQQIVLMDSTYKAVKYNVPLFFLAVLTNVGYFIVATFMTGHENRREISEALAKLKEWNDTWKPQAFMCDLDQREIGAIENTFQDCTVYTCAFHREQAWDRWLRKASHMAMPYKDAVLKDLRQIAGSRNTEELETNINHLRESEIYRTNQSFQRWIDTFWLANKERWVRAFRTNTMEVRIRTTNGVESMHKILKEHYLKNHGATKTLSALVSILVQDFEPESREKYERHNVVARSTFRKYSPDVPLFLHNRPRPFVKHCLTRWNKVTIESIEQTADGFSVCGYNVNTDVPECMCQDFLRTGWPCKHLLAIFQFFPSYGWDFLPPEYQELPVFNLDHNEQVASDYSDRENTINSSQTSTSSNCVRAEMRELLAELSSAAYTIESVDLLKEVNIALRAVVENIRLHTPCVGVLPVRKDRKKQKEVATARPVHTTELLEEDDEISRVLNDIWNGDETYDPIVQIGPYTLRNNSFHYLLDQVSDEVIDASLHILCKQSDASLLHVPCLIWNAILYKQSERLHELMRMEDISLYNILLGAINEGGSHWTLVIVKPKEKTLIYMNPLGELDRTKQLILHNWYNFLNSRFNQNIDWLRPEGWEVITPPHAKQTDGISCGIYVIQLAENYLRGESLLFKWTREQVQQVRIKIARHLLTEGGAIEPDTSEEVIVDVTTDRATAEEDISDTTCYAEKEDSESIQPSPTLPSDVPSGSPRSSTEKSAKPSPPFPRRSSRPPQKKRMRSSFDYPPMKKKSRKYCICQQKNDGRLYWECETCLNWFHPSCLGLDEKSTVENFMCPTCTASMEAESTDDDWEGEKDSIIDMKKAMDLYPCALGHLQTVIACTENECSEHEHMRHHKFIQESFEEIKMQRRKFGFGQNYFTTNTIESITEKLTKDLLYWVRDKRNPVTSLQSMMVKHVVEHSDLWNLFIEYKMLAFQYVLYVLAKEILILIAAQLGQPYEKCEEQCMETEKDRRQLGF